MPNQNTKSKIWAVVPAAGSGQRMKSDVAKQYLKIDDKTVLEITLATLLDEPEIGGVVVCLASDDTQWSSLASSENPLVIDTVGGDTRAQSVLNGLDALEATADVNDWVLVHDAARPCLKPSLLQKLISTVMQTQHGGILAIPVKDTLKVSQQSNRLIQKSLDRSNVWQAQTPQMFRFAELKAALSNSIKDKQPITDEASAMELAGYQPLLIEGDAANIKITTPDDLKLARILSRAEILN